MKNDLTHISLFTGIGGIDLAAEWAGIKTIGQCEIDEYATRVLQKHWPTVPRWRDIHDLRADDIFEATGYSEGEITVLSGGFPCQPHSFAGKRKASADERDLWPEYRRIIRDIRPRWVVAENVRGLLSSENGRFFGGILRDLAELGLDVGWCLYAATHAGASHRRERVFIIAHTHSERFLWRRGCEVVSQRREMGASHEEVRTSLWPEATVRVVRAIQNPETAPEDIRSNYGVSDWVDRVRCLGAAVVPAQAYPIFKAIAEIEGEKGEYNGNS
jgi:DNA (cytosine-5)-methyltransferase 1